MTVDDLLRLAAVTNPGLFMIAAGVLAFFARERVTQTVVLLGGPGLALFALMYSPGAGVAHSTVMFGGLELVLYQPDGLSMVFGLVFILASAVLGVFSLHRVAPVQDSTALIYAGAAVGAVFAGDLLTLFIFWELTAIASVFQVLTRQTAEARAASMRYLVFQLSSGLLLLAGAATHLANTGEIAFTQMADRTMAPPVGVMGLDAPGAWLIFAGFGIKAAFPLVHNWVQDFYPKATATGAVVLSAFTTKLAVYALARYFAGEEALVWIGAIMVVFATFYAFAQDDLRRTLAYSLIVQVGFMVCAVGVGSALAINAAAALAFVGVMYNLLLFMSMGAVLHRTGTAKASELGGLHRTMPYTALFCMIGAASLVAVPFFSGFAGKSMLMSFTHGAKEFYWLWLVLLFASAGLLAHTGIRVPWLAFFGADSGKRPKEAPFNMMLAMGLAAAVSIGVGLTPGWLYELLPYRPQAMEYLAQDLFTPEHIVEQLQLLAFGALAFIVAMRMRLMPGVKTGVTLDAEWLWRKAGPAVVRALSGPAAALWRALVWTGAALVGLANGALRFGLAPSGWASRKILLTAGAGWTLLTLGAVAVIALFA